MNSSSNAFVGLRNKIPYVDIVSIGSCTGKKNMQVYLIG